MTCLGVIGGSGLYNLGDQLIKEHNIPTPWGQTSGPICEVELKGQRVMFLPRHGKHHHLLPSEVPSKANIYALKSLGVKHLLSVSAVGIMKEHITPGDLVIPDQLIDNTRAQRPNSFFGEGCVGHVSLANPFCSIMRKELTSAINDLQHTLHTEGSYICIEGPQFSSRAESNYYRKAMDPSVIGMTAFPEARLAREAEMSYCLLALATDYDCWHESEENVSADAVIAVVKSNSSKAAQVITRFVSDFSHKECACHSAAAYSIMTPTNEIPGMTREKLDLFYKKYWDK
ncbi:MAG: S-methyl-5'-thioadenosine phosphorylase [Oligoflexales bacterium]